jgi:hypothetical protein
MLFQKKFSNENNAQEYYNSTTHQRHATSEMDTSSLTEHFIREKETLTVESPREK